MEKQNKIINIENFILLWYDECAVSFAHVINAVCASDDMEQFKDAMEVVSRDSDAEKFFGWGYDGQIFWLKQRIGYMDDELQETNTITVEFKY